MSVGARLTAVPPLAWLGDRVTGTLRRVARSRVAGPLGWLVLLGSVVALLWSLRLWADWQFTVAARFSDWQTAANAVDRVLAHAPLYHPDQLAGPYYMTSTVLKGWTYSPASIPALLPFASQPAGLWAWLVLNIGVYLGGLAVILRRELGTVAPWPLAMVLLGLAAFRPFGEGVAAGNVNVLLAGIYAWCWASDERRRWIALAAGVALTTKVFPGAIALWAVRGQGWRALAIALGVAIGLALLAVPLGLGEAAWREFSTVIGNSRPPCQSYNAISVACLASAVTGGAMAKLLGYALAIACAIGVVAVRDRFAAFVLLGGAMLLGVTDMHLHFWVFGYVLLVVWLARRFARMPAVPAGPVEAPAAVSSAA